MSKKTPTETVAVAEETREKALQIINQFIDMEDIPKPPVERVQMDSNDTNTLKKIIPNTIENAPPSAEPVRLQRKDFWYNRAQGWSHYFQAHGVTFLWRFLYEYQQLMPRRCRVGRYTLYSKTRRNHEEISHAESPSMCLIILLMNHVMTDPNKTATGDIPKNIQPSTDARWRRCRSLSLLRLLGGQTGEIEDINNASLFFPDQNYLPSEIHLSLGTSETGSTTTAGEMTEQPAEESFTLN